MARRGRKFVVALALVGVTAIAFTSLGEPSIRVVYNASESVPLGWYRIVPVRALAVDEIAVARLPEHTAELAAERGYLPRIVPILKRIGAVPRQHVCVRNGRVHVDGVAVAVARTFDRLGRPLFAWSQCRRLEYGELFLLSATSSASFDSRYFGPIRAEHLVGIARPVWTW
jgi:conjugative transfer signal peptidase TraF